MSIQIAERMHQIQPSPTLAISAKANELRAQGKKIINLSVGEPDFDTPSHIKQAAIEAINNGFTKYTAVDGISSLKQAIIKKFATINELNYTEKQIIVSTGCKQVLYNIMQALLNDRDEVIIPAPFWVSYPDMVKLAGGEPVIISTQLENRFKITAAQLEQAISDKTKLLILNSPSNPTGMAYSFEELQALAQVLLKHPQVQIISDDIYEYIWWAKFPFANIANTSSELAERTIVCNGVSKAYSMTGWRIGYAAGPEKLIAAAKKIQSQSTSNPNSMAQLAAEAALKGDQSCVAEMTAAFKQRHDFVVNKLNAMPDIHCLAADGTFYLFPNVEAVIERLPNISKDIELASYLLETAEIAVVPGTAFGAPGHIRLSIATSMDNLETALERLAQAIR